MTLLGHGIGECLLMARLGHLVKIETKVKLKLRENRNSIKIRI